jgi:hypothetical protein
MASVPLGAGPCRQPARRGAAAVLILAGRAMVATGVRMARRRIAVEAACLRYQEYEELRSRLQAIGHSALPLL